MPNPWIILGVVLALAGSFVAGDLHGHKQGIAEQKVADQAQFDKINAERAEQIATANAAYRKAQHDNLALMVERDQLKTRLEKEHAANQKATDDLHARYAGVGLRFNLAQGTGLGGSGQRAEGTGSNAAGIGSTAVVQLPDSIAANLRQLAYDADQLADSYRECYGYAEQVK
ncbi:MAG: hypothetical protein JSR19_06925 [Proteobacteria bacterium]|nr:hypothetical protein [Pseudomonadota bacterium]HQR02486.1 hypothetical protein [Rhodocyclaceae bacterium]